MVVNTWAYRERSHSGFDDAEKRIDREVKWRMKIMRNNIPQNIINEEDLHLIIYSILSDHSDNWCKSQITGKYKMFDNEKYIDDETTKEIPTIQNNIPSVWLKKNWITKSKEIETLRKWFKNKKKYNSYTRSDWLKNNENFENNFKQRIANHDLRDVALNEIFEFAIWDLMEDFFRQDLLGRIEDVKDIKVHKTSHYDDVMAKSDFIVQFEYEEHNDYACFDFTTSRDVANLERKSKLEWVYCIEFAFHNWIKWKIPRSIFVLNDKEIVFNYLNDYIQLVLKNDWNIKSWEAMKIFENMKIFGSTHDIENIKRNIRKQLFDAA